jgi:hypothetical protein
VLASPIKPINMAGTWHEKRVFLAVAKDGGFRGDGWSPMIQVPRWARICVECPSR